MNEKEFKSLAEIEEDAKSRFIEKLAIERDITYKKAEEIYKKEFEC